MADHTQRAPHDHVDHEAHEPSEQTPLLPQSNQTADDSTRPPNRRSASSLLFANISSRGKGVKRRWPSLLALLLLCILAVLIIVFAFLTPSIVKRYAQQAVTFEPTSLAIESVTSDGVFARVQGDFKLDADKVEPKSVRDLGRFSTWIASKAQSGESKVEVSLPEYGNVVLGTADVPPVVVDLRDGHVTHVDFVADLHPGDVEAVRRIAGDWIEGRLGQLRVLGKADVPLKSGIFNFGTQKITYELLFLNKDIPSMPAYKIRKINIHETDKSGEKGITGDVAIELENPYPLELSVPALAFDILVDNCQPSDPYIKVADASTSSLHVKPRTDIELNATGYVQKLPEVLTQACPGGNASPLDILLGSYISGQKTTVYVKGADTPLPDTPSWITDIISSITVPLGVPGKTFGHLIKNFSMTDTQFSLPSPWAEPGTPEAQPRISATILAVIAIPEEMNFELNVGKIRANATVYYKRHELGVIDLHDWRKASSERQAADKDGPMLLVKSALKDVPLYITDEDVFTDVIQAMLFGSEDVLATIKASVDVQVDTTLGGFPVRNIPAEGEVPIKPISSKPSDPDNGRNATTPADFLASLSPQVYDLRAVSTSPDSLTMSALVNFSNPTAYEVDIPYISVHILTNSSIIANASLERVYISQGNNTALRGTGTWNPLALSGEIGTAVEFMSRYLSGYNTTVQLRFHEQSVPANPALSRMLSRFNLTIPTPSLPPVRNKSNKGDPNDPDRDSDPPENGPRFIDSARFHLFSSTADFVLLSPLQYDTIFVTSLNASASYRGHRVGTVQYDEPFAVLPIDSEGRGSLTPRVPVHWETGGVGWDAVKGALGGTLKLAAEAVIGIQIGQWKLQNVWYRTQGLGVGVGA